MALDEIPVVADLPGTGLTGQAEAVWHDADRLARMARAAGVEARVVLREGERSDLYASLGYDDLG